MRISLSRSSFNRSMCRTLRLATGSIQMRSWDVRPTPAAAVRAVVPSARADLLTFVALPRARIQVRDREIGASNPTRPDQLL
jgi:hypothetical protein